MLLRYLLSGGAAPPPFPGALSDPSALGAPGVLGVVLLAFTQVKNLKSTKVNAHGKMSLPGHDPENLLFK
jgi:hypothetical protein